jgi:uncharacterized membrane protein YedE/YeeE
MQTEHWLGLVTGVIFGFLLQKGRVLRFDKQIGAMLFKDMTILKFMLSAIIVGSVGITLLAQNGVITLSHKPMNVGAVLIGGALFGIGWGIMGFCPGTSVGAVAEGRLHAIFAVIGMITGAAIYAELYPYFKTTILAWKDFGKIGLPDVLGVSPWVIVVALWVVSLGLFAWFEKKGI